MSFHPNMYGFGGRPLAYIDLEFTGLDPSVHDITEIAVLLPNWANWASIRGHTPELWLTEPWLKDWAVWVQKVWPDDLSTATTEALQINGFDEATWKLESENLRTVLGELKPLIDGVTLVGHNVHLDIAFLRNGYRRCGISAPEMKYKVDTATLIWEHLVPLGLTHGNLHDVCEVLQISNEGEHRALADVLRTKAVVDVLVFSACADVPEGPGTMAWVASRIAELEKRRQS